MRLSRDLSSTPPRSVTGGLRVLRRPGLLPRCSLRARGRVARRACPPAAAGVRRPRGESNIGSVASPQASVSSSAAASCSAAAIPQGPSSVLDRKTSIPAAARLAHQLARWLEAAGAGHLDVHHVARLQLRRAAQLAQRGHRLVSGDRRWTPAGAPPPARAASGTAARRARGRSPRCPESHARPRRPSKRRWHPREVPATAQSPRARPPRAPTSSGSPTFSLKQA